ncbi:MAG: RDD family protein [Actinomycetes bacterium]|jgi:uncharacterized RDD family membrane protein YckC
MSESANWQPPTPGISANFNSPLQSEKKAGFWMRFIAHICDGLNSLLVILPFQILNSILMDNNQKTLASLTSVVGGAATIFVLAKWIGERGGSPLRVKTGVLVLDENDGSYIGIKRALIRILMSYVSQIVLLLGYLWMLWDANNQTWHDKVAKSVVVQR